MSKTFEYNNPKVVHHVPFLRFTDAGNKEFVDSDLYAYLKQITFHDTSTGRTDTCNVDNHNGLVFYNMKGDYDYLTRWYHNPFKGANTRHGSYIMLYWIETDYYWKLSQSFFTKIMTIPDNISDLFDFG